MPESHQHSSLAGYEVTYLMAPQAFILLPTKKGPLNCYHLRKQAGLRQLWTALSSFCFDI